MGFAQTGDRQGSAASRGVTARELLAVLASGFDSGAAELEGRGVKRLLHAFFSRRSLHPQKERATLRVEGSLHSTLGMCSFHDQYDNSGSRLLTCSAPRVLSASPRLLDRPKPEAGRSRSQIVTTSASRCPKACSRSASREPLCRGKPLGWAQRCFLLEMPIWHLMMGRPPSEG